MSATATARPGAIRPTTTATAASGRLVRFQIGGQPFALPLDRVAEVVALGAATNTAPRGWLGTLARPQGSVPIGDLGYLLGNNPQAGTRREMRAVLLRGRATGAELAPPTYGVTVESVPTVIELGAVRPEPLPSLVRRQPTTLVRASLIQGDELLFILDPDAIIARLAVGVVRVEEGRISELRALPRRETGRVAAPAARPAIPAPPQTETRALLLAGIETADGSGGLAPAVPMHWIQEVRAMQAVRPVPHAPVGLTGVIAWRGRCLPVIDLTQRLTGIPSTEGSARRLLIVGPQRGEALGGIVVPGVRGLTTIAAGDGEAPPLPDTLDPGLLHAWTRHNDEAVAILDPVACFA